MRIGRACAEGVIVIGADGRTPHIIADPSVQNGNLTWGMQTYMHTPAAISATWASIKNGQPYAANFARLDERNKFDERRQHYPNFAPKESRRVEVTSLNYESLIARAREGTLWLADLESHLYVVNDGTFPLPEMKEALSKIIDIALRQANSEITRIAS